MRDELVRVAVGADAVAEHVVQAGRVVAEDAAGARGRVEEPVRQEALGCHVRPVVVEHDARRRVGGGQHVVADELAR